MNDIADQIARLMQHDGKRRRNAAVIAVIVSTFLLLFFLERAKTVTASAIAASAGLLGLVAAAAAVRLRRFMPFFFAGALVATVAFTAFVSGHGLFPMRGIECLLITWLFTAFAAVPLIVVTKRVGDPIDPWRVTAWTALGGALGCACLSVACQSHDALEHALVFHLGAVVSATAIMRMWARR